MSDLPGIAISPRLPGGQSAASVDFTAEAVVARTADGTLWKVPFTGLRLARGGASGDMVFFHPPGDDPIIASEGLACLAAFDEASGRRFTDEIARLRGQGRGRRSYALGCLAVLLSGVIALVLILPWAWRSARAGLVDRLPASVDQQLGDAAWGEFASQDASARFPASAAAIRALVERIAATIPRDDIAAGFTYQAAIIDRDEANAFALPGGRMVVYTGLLRRATAVDQLAGVIGHEIAHVARRHGLRAMVDQAGTMLVLSAVVGDVGGAVGVLTQGATVALLSAHSRDHERDADREGARMLAAAGLDPRGLIAFFRLLESMPGTQSPGALAWISSHPQHAERIAALEALIPTLPRVQAAPLAIDWSAVQAEVGPVKP